MNKLNLNLNLIYGSEFVIIFEEKLGPIFCLKKIILLIKIFYDIYI